MYRRIAAPILAAAILVSLTACGEKTPASSAGEPSGTASVSASVSAPASASASDPASPTSSASLPAAPSPTASASVSATPAPSASASQTSSDEPPLPEPSLDANGDPLPRLIESGTVGFQAGKGDPIVKLPLYGAEAAFGVDNGSPPSIVPEAPLATVAFRIPEDQADSLAAYWMNLGFDGQGYLVVAPRGWIVKEATVGANGSYRFELMNPDDDKESLVAYDTGGGCQGCAISSIGSYFPKLRDWAEEQSFPGDPMPYTDSKTIGDSVIEFSLASEQKGYATRGAAYEQHGGEEGARFGSMTLSAKEELKDLNDSILSFFETVYGEAISG
ncbi:DUF4850 domain-containing protein [Cohnella xylanilytica]|uniref:DUF4850 domain-containing protein n=1 Tax=Cohnella xylanilytica TaxID=557555 RepID=A0A841UCB5_9BACL|nr:DUF4850 domain-containing protein [Cohnella xylanilytica]MBB6695591.1 DUF4850 domain-containing protein [Cohnella xylanilytica]